ncbi:MAG: LacI family transcriptional regulator [Gemmatimonadota bacterium]|nr:LacI family transcriptional regulator [Gemmatimonadota bacterium]
MPPRNWRRASALSAAAVPKPRSPTLTRLAHEPTRVTMQDVATRAGVSQPTVSLVIGNSTTARISKDTRERVLAAASELGYRPNVVARGLVQSRSYSLGLVVPNLLNPFFTDVVSGAERVATEEGYAVLLCDVAEGTAEHHLDALRSRQIDGVIIDAAGATALASRALADLNVVLIDGPSDAHLSIASDAHGAGKLAAEHLLSLGHKRIGFLGPATDAWAQRMRERGFMKTLAAAAVRVASDDLRRAPAPAAGGESAMRALLAHAPRPSAVFCANDLMAIGALKACAAAGVSVPSQMSLVGCDDIEMARLVTPELTTVSVRPRELGARAARTLIKLLRGEAVSSSKPLAVSLVVRGTTARVARSKS